MRQISSKSGLAIALSRLEGFERPKVIAEQYAMDSEIGAFVLWNAALKGDMGKVSVDLGCGTGILGIGALLMGSKKVYFVDNDKEALKIAKNNLEKAKSEFSIAGKAVFLCLDIADFNEKADTVIQNPPFGVKVRHADRIFLEKAMETGNVAYSFHKSEGKKFIFKFVDEKNFTVTNVWDFKFPLKASYEFHSRRIKRVDVSCFRIQRKDF
ncbi:methyltransferase [Candidatus Woesearchaeota archaeon]|nr:methyltransferase [Candidatus Woesearchaeota archaeon]